MKTILLVEDEEIVRRVISRPLQRAGYKVIEAPGPAEAIELARIENGALDLLITDVLMPGMNGPKLVEALGWGSETPVIFVSGYPKETLDGMKLLPPGAVVICKPFKTPDLIATVRRLIDPDVDVLSNLDMICMEII